MNLLRIVLLVFLISSWSTIYGQYGSVDIREQLKYEIENDYFPHDHFTTIDMEGLLDNAVKYEIMNDTIKITNTYNSGFGGHEVIFSISKELDIIDVQYDMWTDLIDGSETRYSITEVSFSTNEDPFKTKYLTGHYRLKIREDFIAGELLKSEGVNDTTTYRLFKGKFKFYSKEDINKIEKKDRFIMDCSSFF